MAIIALMNIRSITREASMMNLLILSCGFLYGGTIFTWMKISGYHPVMKYVSSFIDIFLVHLLLFFYTFIDIPAIAMKNYVYMAVFPLILLSAFRFDWKLTALTGLWAIGLYVGMFFYLFYSGQIVLVDKGYGAELFGPEITIIGQLTKIILLASFVELAAYFAHYSRKVISATIRNEVEHQLKNEEITHELEMASQVQQLLLPHTAPTFAGLSLYGTVIQGKYIGGDYYDFIEIKENKLLVVIADVSWNGIPAALIMAEIRGAIYSLSSQYLSLPEFVRRLNSVVLQSTDKKMFVTGFFAEIDTDQQTISYINAGHPPAFILHQGRIESLANRTVALGMVESLPTMELHVVDFPHNSLFVAYTDGILEYTNKEEEEFGDVRLREFLSKS